MTTPADNTPAASPVRLPGFDYQRIDVDGVMINCAIKGTGPPLLMLHGYPQNHLIWRHVAPALAGDHTVVLADLRGYGDSGKPAPDAAGLAYSKRSMARDQVGLMRQLGFTQFQLASHDRGARGCFRDSGTIAGSCADYRSAAGIDLVHDDETFAAGQKIDCPVLVLWGRQSFVGRGYEPFSVWQQYATDVRGDALPVGHFLPEEAPDLVTAALRSFFD